MQNILLKLNKIRNGLLDIIINITERGTNLNILKDRSNDLVESSESFLVKTRPWYCPPSWWFRCCKRAQCFDEGPYSCK